MVIIYVYIIASFLASLLIISACMLSSRISQQENLVEVYEQAADSSQQLLPSTPF
jgi:hypothetical protein